MYSKVIRLPPHSLSQNNSQYIKTSELHGLTIHFLTITFLGCVFGSNMSLPGFELAALYAPSKSSQLTNLSRLHRAKELLSKSTDVQKEFLRVWTFSPSMQTCQALTLPTLYLLMVVCHSFDLQFQVKRFKLTTLFHTWQVFLAFKLSVVQCC